MDAHEQKPSEESPRPEPQAVPDALDTEKQGPCGRHSDSRVVRIVLGLCLAILGVYLAMVASCIYRIWSNPDLVEISPAHANVRWSWNTYIEVPWGGSHFLLKEGHAVIGAAALSLVALSLAAWLLLGRRRPSRSPNARSVP